MVVVLTHDSADVVDDCLDHLAASAYSPLEVVVVDNASSDGTVTRVTAGHRSVTLIEAGGNLGWSAGNTLGLAHAAARGAEYVVLLNPDVLVPPGWLAAAVPALEARPALALMDFDLLSGREGALPGHAMGHVSGTGTVRPVDGASGAALVVRVAALPVIGVPDPDYFLYCEDVDWSWRALAAGVEVGRLDVPLWHASEGSSGADSPRRRRLRSWLSFRNSLRLYIKHRPRQALGWIKSMFIYACSPTPPAEDIMNRFRPFGPVRNAAMVVAAVGWNVLHLPATLRVRRRERRRTAARSWSVGT